METLTDLTQADAARRQRAYRLERALSEQATQEKRRATLAAALTRYTDQVSLLDTLAQLVANVDPTIGLASGFVRVQLVNLIARAHDDQQRRADDTKKKITQNETEAAQTAAVLAELQS